MKLSQLSRSTATPDMPQRELINPRELFPPPGFGRLVLPGPLIEIEAIALLE